MSPTLKQTLFVMTMIAGLALALLLAQPVAAQGPLPPDQFCHFFMEECDFGDAPDPTYPTLMASNGAAHWLFPGVLHLGPLVDGEPDGQPDPFALGDDITFMPDEDGVRFLTPLAPGKMATVEVSNGGADAGWLDAWIDFNQDGVFSHPDEHLFPPPTIPPVHQIPGNTTLVLVFQVPPEPDVVVGETFARFRLTHPVDYPLFATPDGLLPEGFGGVGEVEDYLVEIENFPQLYYDGSYYELVELPDISWDDARNAAAGMTWPGCNEAHLVTITSQGEQDALTNFYNGALQDKWYGGFQNPPIEPNPNQGWEWVTGETWDYTNWGPGEPNDAPAGSYVPASEQYLKGINQGLDWSDSPNVFVSGYVVEYDDCAPTLLYVDDATRYLHGSETFEAVVRLDAPGLDLSSVSFMLDYDPNCLTFDGDTDSDNDGVPDAVRLPDYMYMVDSFFDVTYELGDDGSGGDALTLLIKPVSPPPATGLPVLLDGDLAYFEFGVKDEPGCFTDVGDDLIGDLFVDFDFLDGDDPIVPSFGDSDGQTVAGTTQGGTYTLFFNSRPTDITLDPTTVDENMPAGTRVGDLTTTDRDLELPNPPVVEGHSYSVVADVDCEAVPPPGVKLGAYAFQIGGVAGNELQISSPLDFEVDSFFDVCVRTTDAWGLYHDNILRVTVNDKHEGPTDITLDDNMAPENHGAPTTVGILSTTDQDLVYDDSPPGPPTNIIDAHLYAWCGAPPAEFTLVQASAPNPAEVQLTGSPELNYEDQNSYNVCIRTTDTDGLSIDKPFTIVVENLNDAPVAEDDSANPPLIVVGGATELIDVLANDHDEDVGQTLAVHDVTQGINGGTVVNNGGDVSYTAPDDYNGPDSFTYQIKDSHDPYATSEWATVSLHVVADDVRADCNSDGKVDAADFPATVLEIFDRDFTEEPLGSGNYILHNEWWLTWLPFFEGSPRGCDSNGSENGLDGLQPSVDAADIICTVLIFFAPPGGEPACSSGGLLAARATNNASLAVADMQAAAGETVAVPVRLESGGANAAALTFAFEYDTALVSFDAADDDHDGVPDALTFNVPANMAQTVMMRRDGRIEVALYSTTLPLSSLADGTIATVTLQVNADVGDASTLLRLDTVSLGTDQAESVAIDAVNGVLTIGEGGLMLENGVFLPLIAR